MLLIVLFLFQLCFPLFAHHICMSMLFCVSSQEIALRIPLDAWSSYEAALEESPVATKTMINVVIYLLGDWLSQTVFAKQNILDFDLGRTLRNGLIGLCFGPLVHEYYQFSDTILPVDGGLGNRVLKILMDQSIYLVVKCSLYILAVNTLQGQDFETSTRLVKEKIGGIVLTAWKFWPLVHCITYSVIPARHRILWVNCVDLVWNAILASMSQQSKDDDDDAINVAVPDDAQIATLGTDDIVTGNPLLVSNESTGGTGAFVLESSAIESESPIDDEDDDAESLVTELTLVDGKPKQ